MINHLLDEQALQNLSLELHNLKVQEMTEEDSGPICWSYIDCDIL